MLRIISLVPSITELLYELGLDNRVVGITKFCVHPEVWFRSKMRIGGTKDVKTEKVAALQPDLILANKEENVKEQVESLASIAPVWVSDINNLSDAIDMIQQVGVLTKTGARATEIITQIQTGFEQMEASLFKQTPKTCLYLIWQNPYMSVGNDTFINDMMQRCRLHNVLSDKTRYPQLTDEDIRRLSPEIVILSSEPYPFREKHASVLQRLLPNSIILLADGEMFSWYGSRLLHSPAYFCSLWKRINSSSTVTKS